MTRCKLAAFPGTLALISVASHSANAAPTGRGHVIQCECSKALNSDHRAPTTGEALDERVW